MQVPCMARNALVNAWSQISLAYYFFEQVVSILLWMLLSYTVCASPRNSTWFTRPFLPVRGWCLGTRLGSPHFHNFNVRIPKQKRLGWGCAQITAVGRPSRSKSATWFMGPGVDAFVQMYMHLEILLLPHSIQMKKEPGSPPTVLEFHEQSGVGEEMVIRNGLYHTWKGW